MNLTQMTIISTTAYMKWQPTPVSLPGKSHGQRSLVSCSPWGRKESGTTERLTLNIIIVPCTLTMTSRVRGLTGSKESSFYHWANLNQKSRDVLLYNPTPVSSQLQAPEETDKESTLLLLGPASSSLPVEIHPEDPGRLQTMGLQRVGHS